MKTDVELLPCPFCGSTQDAPIHRVVHTTFDELSTYPYGVQCDGCCAFTGSMETEDEAVDAWNTRIAAIPSADGLRDEWQPIEATWKGPAYEHGVTWGDDAPRDGTDVMLFVESTGEQFIGYWKDGSWVYALHRGTQICCEPTHWRPLPAPPALASKGGE